jgi:hypothetical protein
MLCIPQNFLNGYLLKILKIVYITQEWFLIKFYSANWSEGRIEFWDINNQKWNRESSSK